MMIMSSIDWSYSEETRIAVLQLFLCYFERYQIRVSTLCITTFYILLFETKLPMPCPHTLSLFTIRIPSNLCFIPFL